MAKILRRAKDGCADDIKVCGMYVYHVFEPLATTRMSALGALKDTDAFICSRGLEPNDQQLVKNMLVDWQLYEHGWLVTTGESGRFRNETLFYYKCQMGDCGKYRPVALDLLESPAKVEK